jgi:hypothetical protein
MLINMFKVEEQNMFKVEEQIINFILAVGTKIQHIQHA